MNRELFAKHHRNRETQSRRSVFRFILCDLLNDNLLRFQMIYYSTFVFLVTHA